MMFAKVFSICVNGVTTNRAFCKGERNLAQDIEDIQREAKNIYSSLHDFSKWTIRNTS